MWQGCGMFYIVTDLTWTDHLDTFYIATDLRSPPLPSPSSGEFSSCKVTDLCFYNH